ncbi:MAG: hypothetical protein ACR2GD_12875 [Pyrinomonadaceae bacterium]
MNAVCGRRANAVCAQSNAELYGAARVCAVRASEQFFGGSKQFYAAVA